MLRSVCWCVCACIACGVFVLYSVCMCLFFSVCLSVCTMIYLILCRCYLHLRITYLISHVTHQSCHEPVMSHTSHATNQSAVLPRTHFLLSFDYHEERYDPLNIVQPIAVGVSFNLNLQSQSHMSLFNGAWQKRSRGLDHRLRSEKEEMALQMQ